MATKKTPYEELVGKIQNGRKKLDTEMSKEMAKAYRDGFINAYNELEKMIERSYDNGGEAVEDLILAKVEYVRQIHNASEKIIEKYQDLQCKEYKDAYMAFFESTLPYYEGSQFMKTVGKKIDVTNKRILQIMDAGGIYKDKAGLSDRVWGAAEFAGNKLQEAIMSCIAQGKGPADIAKTIQEFGTAGHKIWSRDKIKEKLGPGYASKYSGGLDYAALRLARTTMTHLHQLEVIKSNEFNPYVGKIRYHSVHADGRTCNICNERDGQIFSRSKCPLDHPNGMCWLEPVFTDSKGNIMTPEQMGEDIGKWIRGEKNTGVMDKIPEYKNLPVVNTSNKKKKATTSKTTKTTKAAKKTNAIPDEQFNNYYAYFSDKVSKSNHAEYLREAANTLKDKYPKFAQEGYLNIYDGILALHQKNEGAYWNHACGLVQFNIDRVLDQVKRTGRGKFDTWFHETGHAMDSLLAEKIARKQHKYSWKPLSSKRNFINALYTDLENQRLMVKKKYLANAGENLADYTDEMIHEILPDSELQSIYYDLLARNNKTAGIQDVLEGLTNCKIKVRWGHGKEYWNRKNRNEEVASEAWANILGSYSDEETNELMREYFPTAMKEQEKIINNAIKTLNKLNEEAK